MGNTNGQARGFNVGRSDARREDDPFAELADIFETELRFGDAVPRAPAKAPGGSHDADLVDEFGPEDIEADLARAFEAEAAGMNGTPARTPQFQTNYQSATKPRLATVRKPSGTASRPTHLTDEEIDGELESVLRNLSAPAKPRDRIVVETQSFAPARVAEEEIASVVHAEVDEFEELIRSELAAIRPAARATARPPEAAYPQSAQQDYADDEFVIADEPVAVRRRAGRLRPLLFGGASVAALLIVGGVGAAFWHGSASLPGVTDEPLLIKADAEPYKVTPKDPGGRAYPNQNKAVYDRVAGAASTTPVQQALLSNAETPMDLPADEDGAYADDLPGVEVGGSEEEPGKDETRVTESTETDASAESVLQPRKVRTMTVTPDGQLVMAAAQQAPAASAAPTAPAKPVATTAAKTPAPAVETPAEPDPIKVAAVAPTPAAPPPAETEAAPVAAAAPAAMPTGGFFVQVASQPSEAAAQQSMRNFGAKYGNVVAGRPVGIQSAEIAGKGTYYRVRVAAETREEANGVCSKLKSAGATCFVTR